VAGSNVTLSSLNTVIYIQQDTTCGGTGVFSIQERNSGNAVYNSNTVIDLICFVRRIFLEKYCINSKDTMRILS
jgi:hypothetical protein